MITDDGYEEWCAKCCTKYNKPMVRCTKCGCTGFCSWKWKTTYEQTKLF